MNPGLVVRAERAGDHAAVREVHRRAFGDGGRVPALVDALRTDRRTLSLVAIVDDVVAGYPPAFQVAKLSSYAEWMTGTFVHSDVFWAMDCVGLRGERLRNGGSRSR